MRSYWIRGHPDLIGRVPITKRIQEQIRSWKGCKVPPLQATEGTVREQISAVLGCGHSFPQPQDTHALIYPAFQTLTTNCTDLIAFWGEGYRGGCPSGGEGVPRWSGLVGQYF